jgi:hypothetical protein
MDLYAFSTNGICRIGLWHLTLPAKITRVSLVVNPKLIRSVLGKEYDMAEPKMPHLEHGKHLCYLNNLNYQMSNPEKYKALVQKGRFYCQNCGRVAASDKNLCNPVKL